MPILPIVRKPKRRSETVELVHPIRIALNKLPGVRVWRNNSGVLKDPFGTPVRYGLGTGSADLIGLCCRPWTPAPSPARFLALEVKRRGEYPTVDQAAWLRCVRELGGFACVVHSVDEALAAVQRCREGHDQ
jgi:hypothetical protein